jgi:hypothetical protein
MVTSDVQRTRYAVFVRFRRSRLVLRRGIVELEEALKIALQLRADRLHGRDDLFVLRQPDGEVIPLPDDDLPEDESADAAASAEARADASAEHANGVAEHALPEPEPVDARTGPNVARLERMRRAIEKSRAARARMESTLSAMERQIEEDGDEGSALAHLHAQLHEVHDATVRAAGSFEAVTALLVRKLAR